MTDRQAQALKLRGEDLTYREIGQRLQISTDGARQLVTRALVGLTLDRRRAEARESDGEMRSLRAGFSAAWARQLIQEHEGQL